MKLLFFTYYVCLYVEATLGTLSPPHATLSVLKASLQRTRDNTGCNVRWKLTDGIQIKSVKRLVEIISPHNN